LDDYKKGKKPLLAEASGKPKPRGPSNHYMPFGPVNNGSNKNSTKMNPDDLFSNSDKIGKCTLLMMIMMLLNIFI
jgi:hypothetical protein